MQEIFEKLGVNWKLLLAQAVNFGLLLIVLRFTVYKPLLEMLAKRRKKIEQGLKDAEEAGERLKEAEGVKREKLKEAEAKSMVLLRGAEEKSKIVETELLAVAHKKEADIVAKARLEGERLVEEEKEKFYAQAAGIVKEAIVKLVETKREMVDDYLIKETVKKMKESSA